jgi:hypothetical protein
MRKYIRHPSDIPIEFDVSDALHEQRESLNNVSIGGLSFQSRAPLVSGALVTIRVPFVKPSFEVRSRVVWCKRRGMSFDIGVELLDRQDAFLTRMVEQICHIEHYKREVLRIEGRHLSGQEAALEWIGKYAHLFPDFS